MERKRLWSESGGPPVAEPVRKGFGSVILFDAAKTFGMDIDLKYPATGLVYELRVPLRDITQAKHADVVVPPSGMAL